MRETQSLLPTTINQDKFTYVIALTSFVLGFLSVFSVVRFTFGFLYIDSTIQCVSNNSTKDISYPNAGELTPQIWLIISGFFGIIFSSIFLRNLILNGEHYTSFFNMFNKNVFTPLFIIGHSIWLTLWVLSMYIKTSCGENSNIDNDKINIILLISIICDVIAMCLSIVLLTWWSVML